MVGCDPGKADGSGILCGGEGDVGEGFGAGSDKGACGGFGGVRDCGDDGSCGGGEELHLWRELRGGFVGDQRGDGNADEGVGRVPDEIEARNLVGDEFEGE